MQLIAGVDEVGRGPLAGDVVAAAVILNPKHTIDGIKDSKQLTERQRERLYEAITKHALSYAIGRASPAEIDQINILQASLLAMQRAVEGLSLTPTKVLVDGHYAPNIHCPVEAIIKGDQLVTAISAASILAKVTRDREMAALDRHYPGYGFATHKGYATQTHLDALRTLGPCEVHRQSFAPVRELLLEAAT